MSTARFALFSVLLGVLIWAANRYFRRWLVGAFALSPRWARILDVALYVALFGSVVRPFRPFTLVAASVELTVLLSLVPLWAIDITRWLLKRAAPPLPTPPAPTTESAAISPAPTESPVPAPTSADPHPEIELPFSRRALLSRA
ncbi:MAG TPA: hypothetical protein VFQ61_12435, partial [Polyangiaceae bacterium]|nr:hypothetical protein [Polyangiaceae bacterium]